MNKSRRWAAVMAVGSLIFVACGGRAELLGGSGLVVGEEEAGSGGSAVAGTGGSQVGGAGGGVGGMGGGAVGGSGGSAVGGTGGGAVGGSGGASTDPCPLNLGLPACDICIDANCADSCQQCAVDPACSTLLECLIDCGQDGTCGQSCIDHHPDGIQPLMKFLGENSCVMQLCGDVCDGNSGGAGGETMVCPIQSQYPPCDDCINSHCFNECMACAQNASCTDLIVCLSNCSSDPCEQHCLDQYPQGVQPLMEFLGEDGCLIHNCMVECQ